MKKIILSILITIASFADKSFGSNYNDKVMVEGTCQKASDFNFKVPIGTECLISVQYGFYQPLGTDLIKKAKVEKYHPVTFWVEELVDSSTYKWKKITPAKQFRYNGFAQPVKFKVNSTKIVRVAKEYIGQYSYADEYSREFKIYVKNK